MNKQVGMHQTIRPRIKGGKLEQNVNNIQHPDFGKVVVDKEAEQIVKK
ncbi:MAG: hypothetical protein PHV20_12445 [Bacteroidales bacterium]|nr:hypothetical protein [Bacteroidales bacterium]